VDLTAGNTPASIHPVVIKEARYNFIGDAACAEHDAHCAYVWAGSSHANERETFPHV
jgi:hypothetical protein